MSVSQAYSLQSRWTSAWASCHMTKDRNSGSIMSFKGYRYAYWSMRIYYFCPSKTIISIANSHFHSLVEVEITGGLQSGFNQVLNLYSMCCWFIQYIIVAGISICSLYRWCPIEICSLILSYCLSYLFLSFLRWFTGLLCDLFLLLRWWVRWTIIWPQSIRFNWAWSWEDTVKHFHKHLQKDFGCNFCFWNWKICVWMLTELNIKCPSLRLI